MIAQNIQEIYEVPWPFVTFKTYEEIENVLGTSLKKTSGESMKKVLEDKIKATKETYTTKRYGRLPTLAIMVDMGWQKIA